MSDIADLLASFTHDEDRPKSRESYVRAPFRYPGGKYRSLEHIIPRLPVRSVWVEAFGGSGVVTLNRTPSPLEVYNDRYGGMTAFYRCIREPELLERLRNTPYSREEFLESVDWQDCDDPIERACRWYVSVAQSFGAYGKAWGRGTEVDVTGSWNAGLERFPAVRERMRYVQVENLDWKDCLRDYDSEDAVIYCDPPYFATHEHAYDCRMTREDHIALCETVWDCKGFVAISGYATSLYEKYPWDAVVRWQSKIRILGRKGDGEREETEDVEECLWIKE